MGGERRRETEKAERSADVERWKEGRKDGEVKNGEVERVVERGEEVNRDGER